MRRLLAFLLLAASVATAQTPKLPKPDHIVIVIEENKSFDDIITSGNAPYIANTLAPNGASLTKFTASHHPSQPNYIDFFAGQTFDFCDDTCSYKPRTADNLGAALIKKNLSFTGYAESIPANHEACLDPNNKQDALFARKHCPWLNFANVPPSATLNFDKFPQDEAGFKTLKTVSLVIPNLINDMHNGSSIPAKVKTGDTWLKTNLNAYATWAEKNNSLLIVTWDEDSSTTYKVHCPSVIVTPPPPNPIATIVVGGPVKAGTKSAVKYTHADLLRTILDMYGITPFGDAATAKDIADIWK